MEGFPERWHAFDEFLASYVDQEEAEFIQEAKLRSMGGGQVVGRRSEMMSAFSRPMAVELRGAFPHILKAVRSLPELFGREEQLAKLRPHRDKARVRFTRREAHAVLCGALFCVWPFQDGVNSLELGSLIANARGSASERAKLACFIHYFSRLSEIDDTSPFWDETVVIDRVELEDGAVPDWASCERRLSMDDLVIEHGTIDAPEHAGCWKADFANKFIGGGVLSGGSVQEEILFSVCPEACISMICMPVMGDREAIRIRGAARFSETRGYARGLEFAGDFFDDDRNAMLVCIDAQRYRRGASKEEQLKPGPMRREIEKVFAALSVPAAEDEEEPREARDRRVFVTGAWGCGAFHGAKDAKLLCQWIACTASGFAMKWICYEKFEPELLEFARKYDGKTFKEVFRMLDLNAAFFRRKPIRK